MPHTVRKWMSKPVIVVDPDSSISYALTLMRRRGVRSLVVDMTETNPSYGIITTTDIVEKIVAAGRDLAETRVREFMSGPILTAKPEWSLKACSIAMQKHKIHHMPVEGKRGELVGMISATDIFMAVEEAGWGGGEVA